MSVVMIVNEKWRERVPAWGAFEALPDNFPAFFQQVLNACLSPLEVCTGTVPVHVWCACIMYNVHVHVQGACAYVHYRAFMYMYMYMYIVYSIYMYMYTYTCTCTCIVV